MTLIANLSVRQFNRFFENSSTSVYLCRLNASRYYRSVSSILASSVCRRVHPSPSFPVVQRSVYHSDNKLSCSVLNTESSHATLSQKINRFWRSYTKPPKGFEKFYPKSERKAYLSKKDGDKKGDKKPGGFPNLDPQQIVLLGCIGGLLLLSSMDMNTISNEITYQEFVKNYLSVGKVDRIQVVNKEYCRVILHDESHAKPSKFVTFKLGNSEGFEQRLETSQIELGIHPKDNIPVQHVEEFNIGKELKGFVPTILIFLVFSFLLQRLSVKGGGPGGVDKFLKMGKATPVSAKDMKSKTKFTDVAGMREAKKEIVEFVDFLKDPKKYEDLGARVPKGALLCGPPGTGKTLLAKAVAGEASVPFFTMSGADFMEIFVGVGPSRVRDLFAQARKHSPSIIFIDEIDAVGRKRNKGGFAGGGNDERESTLNQLLVEMDGFTKSTGVVVLAGTNRYDILDPALTRPGRFDRTVNIELPDLEERKDIFMVHLKPLRLATKVDTNEIARRLSSLCPGFAGADIANVCNEAAILAARRNSIEGVEMDDFERASERVLGGLTKNNLMDEKQRRVVAYHEAGHALIGWLLKNADPVLKVSIVPRGNGALGFAQHLPQSVQLYSKEALEDKIAVVLGGRAAEEVIIGEISSGAADDLDKVTKLSYAFVSQLGMNSLVGLVSFQNVQNEGNQFYRPYSETTAQLIDQEVKQLIESQYARVKDILTEKKHLLHKLAELLFSKETVAYQDIVDAIGERPFPMNSTLEDYVKANVSKSEILASEPSHETPSVVQGDIAVSV